MLSQCLGTGVGSDLRTPSKKTCRGEKEKQSRERQSGERKAVKIVQVLERDLIEIAAHEPFRSRQQNRQPDSIWNQRKRKTHSRPPVRPFAKYPPCQLAGGKRQQNVDALKMRLDLRSRRKCECSPPSARSARAANIVPAEQ